MRKRSKVQRAWPWERALSFTWGLAEATVFFIVPDVWITILATRRLSAAWHGVGWALAGALIGGALMWSWGSSDPESARRMLDAVPAISPALINKVQSQTTLSGLWALFLGPLGGIPYKVYAVEWGARHGSLVIFLFASVAARGLRFALSAWLCRFVLDRFTRWTGRRRAKELTVVAIFWTLFYSWYFSYFRG